MPIPQKIVDLTKLALSDRILTYTERKTIVDVAVSEGVPETEIKQYLNNALKERLKYYTKEELTSCPFCGAQIPLISDECLFCGNELNNDHHTPPPFIKSREVDVINSKKQNRKERVKHNEYLAIIFIVGIALILLIALIVQMKPVTKVPESNEEFDKEVEENLFLNFVNPNPQMPVDSICAKYFSIIYNASLWIDAIINKDSNIINFRWNVSVTLESTRLRAEDDMEHLRILLYDSTFNIIEDSIPPLYILSDYDKNHISHWLQEAPDRWINIKFSSEPKPYNINELEPIVEKVKYFSIIAEQK